MNIACIMYSWYQDTQYILYIYLIISYIFSVNWPNICYVFIKLYPKYLDAINPNVYYQFI